LVEKDNIDKKAMIVSIGAVSCTWTTLYLSLFFTANFIRLLKIFEEHEWV
jgi:hypothetical protein